LLISRKPLRHRPSTRLFRRYLFDWRADLVLPLVFLVDAEGWRTRSILPFLGFGTARRPGKTQRHSARPAARQRLALPFEASTLYAQHVATFNWALLSCPQDTGASLQYLSEIVRQTRSITRRNSPSGRFTWTPGAGRSAAALEIARKLNPQSPEVWNNLEECRLRVGITL
jgi:hypothetical protein